MLTKEAVQLFLDKLKPEGVVLLHTSNRYLDLNSVLGAILKELPEGTAGDRRDGPQGKRRLRAVDLLERDLRQERGRACSPTVRSMA